MTRGLDHISALRDALGLLERDVSCLQRWSGRLAVALLNDRRVLVAGNGGSAAEAQHLTAELVGRYQDERQPFSALALHAETSSVTAVANDYGYDDVFARQLRAHGRRGDIFIALSTSGRSMNLLRAAQAARERGLLVWALTGARPNPLADSADEAIAIDASASTVQEAHLVAIHMLCAEIDAIVAAPRGAGVRALEPLV